MLGATLDARSDLFQAGIVLYECLTTKSAFGGGAPSDRLAALMARDADLGGLTGRDALKTTRGNRAKAARLLGASERIIAYKVGKYEIDCSRFKAQPCPKAGGDASA